MILDIGIDYKSIYCSYYIKYQRKRNEAYIMMSLCIMTEFTGSKTLSVLSITKFIR